MSQTKRLTLGLAAGALALGAGLGVTSAATAATTPSPSSTATADSSASTDSGDKGNGKRGGHGRGMDRGQQVAALAAKLGVDESKVSDALTAFREANKPAAAADGAKPDRSAIESSMAKSLAESLGMEESAITAALEELRTEAQSERATALKTKLDTAVTDGKLTQAEADAVTKAFEQGVIGGGGR